jgi:hypothetical protein
VELSSVTYAPDPGLQVSAHLRDVVSKARQSRELPPSTEPSSPTLHPFGFAIESAVETVGYNLFTDIDFAFGEPATDNQILGTDFEWNQGWDFSLVDQLFSTVTRQGADNGHAGPAFWDR